MIIWPLFFQFNQFLDPRAEIHKILALDFLENLRHQKTKRHSEINWPLAFWQNFKSQFEVFTTHKKEVGQNIGMIF